MDFPYVATGTGARAGVARPARTFCFFADALATAAAFLVSYYVVWDSWTLWQFAGLWPEVVPVGLLLVGGKTWILRRPPRLALERLRLAGVWLVAVYLCVVLWILLSRAYYSRSFLLLSFSLLALWQGIDTFVLRGPGDGMRLGAVPSRLVKLLAGLPGIELIFLPSPTLLGPVDGIVLDMHEALPPDWARFVAESAASGVPVYHAAAVYERQSGRVLLTHLGEGWVGDLFDGPASYLPVKRWADALAVALTLPLTLPLAGIVALAIRLDSPGPVLFWQERVGQGGKVFRMVKFRSMRADAEQAGARFADAADGRVTRVGRVLRRFRLDELPQLWNVLRGEMSLIGPRPEQVPFARRFEQEIPFYSWRHRVKPGITGWAQVQQGYAAGLEDTREKLEYDLYYVKHLSPWLDLSIALRTFWIIVTGRGAR